MSMISGYKEKISYKEEIVSSMEIFTDYRISIFSKPGDAWLVLEISEEMGAVPNVLQILWYP